MPKIVEPMRTIYDLVVPPSWESLFIEKRGELERIQRFLDAQQAEKIRIVPLTQDLFRAFELTPFNEIRVVIIGQDPYPAILSNGQPRATGLAFSARPNDVVPVSLKNIFKEVLDNDPTFVYPLNGNLEGWARQGVFLMNMALTTQVDKAGAHSGGIWLPFTREAIVRIVKRRPQTIFVLWGKEAQSIEGILDRCPVLMASHPSGLSAYRGAQSFHGCKHFQTINKILVDRGEPPINWSQTE